MVDYSLLHPGVKEALQGLYIMFERCFKDVKMRHRHYILFVSFHF